MPALSHFAFLFALIIELTKSIKVALFPKIMNILPKIMFFKEHKEQCKSMRYLIETNILINLTFLQHITKKQFSLPGISQSFSLQNLSIWAPIHPPTLLCTTMFKTVISVNKMYLYNHSWAAHKSSPSRIQISPE